MSERVVVEKTSGKTRSFEARLSGTIITTLLQGYKQDDRLVTPAMALLTGDEASLRAVVANLRQGRKLWLTDRQRSSRASKNPYPSLEFPKSAKFKFLWQHHDEGSIVQIYNPDLIDQDSGMVDSDSIRFIAPVIKHWADEQRPLIEKNDPHLFKWAKSRLEQYWTRSSYNEEVWDRRANSLVYAATTFCLYADRRSRVPIMPSLRFQVTLFLECLKAGVVRYPGNETYTTEDFGELGPRFTSDLDQIGFLECLQCRTVPESFEAIVARVVNETAA